MVVMDNILYKLHIGEVLSTVPTTEVSKIVFLVTILQQKYAMFVVLFQWLHYLKTDCISRISPKDGVARQWILLQSLRGECYLIYDFAYKGNLSRYLDVVDGGDDNLDWTTKVSIIKGIAKGLISPIHLALFSDDVGVIVLRARGERLE
ncbi:hypothetical protein POM88_023856 [Heracleum sosnowskyi]|uniref:Uncharacterized protein n=1 Tax=Heracleum sosnowskyi TaxID=360622 RepID=A0AAD8IIE7_9APIA|nr:hypothetical protein POM88_023856 [Heracleum sosnowskyi]